MFVAPRRSYVMPPVKCSSRTVKSKDTLNQCCFQCNASSNMNQWHFFSCPAKFPINISCFFSFSDGNGTGAGALFLKKKEEEEAASSWDIASF